MAPVAVSAVARLGGGGGGGGVTLWPFVRRAGGSPLDEASARRAGGIPFEDASARRAPLVRVAGGRALKESCGPRAAEPFVAWRAGGMPPNESSGPWPAGGSALNE